MRRILLSLAVALILGAVLNVAVAWGFAVRVVPPAPHTAVADREGFYLDQRNGSRWWCQVRRRPGHTQVVWELSKTITRQVVSAVSGDVVVERREVTSDTSTLYSTWSFRRPKPRMSSINENKLMAGDPAEMAKLDLYSWWNHNLMTRVTRLGDDLRGNPVWLDSDVLPRWACNPPSSSRGYPKTPDDVDIAAC